MDTGSSTGSTVGTNNGLIDRERRLIEREEAAIEAMRAAEQLVQETTNRAPQVKVNMDVPLLDECPTFEQYQTGMDMTKMHQCALVGSQLSNKRTHKKLYSISFLVCSI